MSSAILAGRGFEVDFLPQAKNERKPQPPFIGIIVHVEPFIKSYCQPQLYVNNNSQHANAQQCNDTTSKDHCKGTFTCCYDFSKCWVLI